MSEQWGMREREREREMGIGSDGGNRWKFWKER